MNSSFRNVSFNSPGNTSFGFNTTSVRRRRTDADPVIISEDGTFALEHFGTALPSMVRVALNKADDPANVSFRLDRNGWAWLVFKRQLYIWRYAVDTVKRSTVPCRELLLPPSELFHHAKLITVLTTSSPLPACIAASPEGHITYWPNISNESATVSINADLPGQECDSLTSVWPLGCVLATTSATALLIKPGSANKPSLTSISLNSGSKGWLGGLSKRMSYLMPMGTSTMETKRASVATPFVKEDSRPTRRNIYVLAGTHLQVWSLTLDGQQCTSDINLHDLVRNKFQQQVWAEESDPRGIQVWLLDIDADESKRVKILAACVNRTENDRLVHYGILTFPGTSSRLRETMELQLVNYSCEKAQGEEESLYAWKLISTPYLSFMISHEKILVIGSETSLVDSISSDRTGGIFIGGGHSTESMPCIFTPNLGLMIFRPNQASESFLMQESFMDVKVPDHLALSMTQHNLHDLSMSEDSVNRYKSAFLQFCAKRPEESMEILSSLFPLNQPSLAPNDPIDIWTIALCEKFIDEAPVTDPRWTPSFGRPESEDPLGIKSKMLIKNFLLDKKKGLEMFFTFLRATGVWQRLTGVLQKDEIQVTGNVLYNAYEKIGFAIVLHLLQTEGRYRKLLDPAIKSIVAIRQDSRPHAGCLSFNDIFFKDISRVHQILSALIQMEEDVLQGDDPKAILTSISLTSEVILVLFSELYLLLSREFAPIRQGFLVPLLENPPRGGYLMSPWFIQFHNYEALFKQTTFLVKVFQMADGPDSRSDIFKQLEQITDIILDGLKTEVESLKGSDRYSAKLLDFEEKRATLLGHLVTLDSIGAIPLAEKYLDFNVIVSVTYEQKNMEAFQEFFEKYYELGFPTFTFRWFLKQKKDKELIECFSRSKYASILSEFLKDYPNISWHHAALNDDFYGASRTLSLLASTEEVSVDNQKFLFCMSKLALLATGTENVEEDRQTFHDINRNLDIIQFQNELPEEVLEAHGLTRETMHVLTPSQIIDMYTSTGTPELMNFWKAATLAKYMTPDIQAEKRLLIVARAILCDPWGEWEMDHPLDVIVPSMLYRFLSLAISNEENLDDYLNLQELSKLDILEDLFKAGNAKYLLQACEESLRENEMET